MKKSLFTLALTALCAATPVMAAETYAVLDLGRHSLSSCAGCNNTTAVRVGVGYQYSPNWAFETSYAALGTTTSANGISGKAQALQVAAIGRLPVADAFAVTGKLGIAGAMLDVTGGVGNTNINATFGFGAEYTLSKQFTVRAQYENLGRFGNASNTTATMKGTLLSAGIVMNF